MAITIQVRKKGSVTIPAEVREKYNLDEGDVYTLIDLGEGTLLLSPRISQVNRIGGRITELIDEEGLDLDDLLNSLEAEREEYYRTRYAKK